MIQLPKIKRDPKKTDALCQCRPVCKSRRREWKDLIQITSEELKLERKPLAECCRRWPTKVYPNGPCPLFGRSRRIAVKERNTLEKPDVVRICQAPIDDRVQTPYLKYVEMAKRLGAWGAVHAPCAFCACVACPCNHRGYKPHDADRALRRRTDMRNFDARVKTSSADMKIICYTFHPLIQRFVRLWKRVQVVSDWVTFILSIFCCQCWQPVAMSTSTSATSQVIAPAKPFIDSDRECGEPLRPQCTTIDFTPQPTDTEELATRCNQFWDFVKNQRELEGMMVTAEPSLYSKDDENVPVHQKSSPSGDRRDKNACPSTRTHQIQ